MDKKLVVTSITQIHRDAEDETTFLSYSVELRVGRRVCVFGVAPDVAAAILAQAKDDAVEVATRQRVGRFTGAKVTDWVLSCCNDYGRFLPASTQAVARDPKPEPTARELQQLYGQERRRSPLTGHFLRECA